MRDPQRIKTICELIEKAMMIDPDVRFGQLLFNAGYLEESFGYDGGNVEDPYNYEDDKLIHSLQSYIDKYGTK